MLLTPELKKIEKEAEKLDKEIGLYFGDLNEIVAEDFSIVYCGATATNRPINANGYCVTFAYSPNRANKKQIYYVQSDINLSYERTCNAGIWSKWTNVININPNNILNISFDDVIDLGYSSIYAVNLHGVTNTNWKGFPKGAYKYGRLITLHHNYGYAKVQIYITDYPNASYGGVYIRTQKGTWLKVSGTAVEPTE